MKKHCLFTSIIIFISILISCNNGSNDITNVVDNPTSTVITMPVISPAAGDYSEGYKQISITTSNENLEIYYTTDGSTPTSKSSRYTGPFNIIGSKTVKAIACSGNNSSSVVTAIYNLNAGKSSSQLGVITGTIGLFRNLSNDVKQSLNTKTVYIYSNDIPGTVYQSSVGKTFYIDGLDTSKSYTFYFSTKAPGTVISRSAEVQTDETGEAIVSATITDVMPKEGVGVDVATVELKPTGIIKGIAKKYGEDGSIEDDHAGITVFIPGTSYSAFTNSEGYFAISGVPQGLHTIRAMYSGYSFVEQDNVLLQATGEEIPEVSITSDLKLYYARGVVKGSVYLTDSTDGNSGVNVVLTDFNNQHSYTASTTSSGNWTINDVVPGIYSIEFHKDGYVNQTLNDVNVYGAKITDVGQIILKENGGSLRGYVSVTATSNLSGIGVTAIREQTEVLPSKRYYSLTTSDGSFTFNSVSPGTYSISVTYPGYKTVSVSNIIVSIGQDVDVGLLQINEKSTYSVTGSCVLAGIESGFEGTNVLLQSLSKSNNSKSTVTNSDGIYTFVDVDSGSYMLTFTHTGFVTDATKTVDVGLRAIEVVESVALQTNAGIVTGNVSLESADTHEGITILIYKETDSSVSYSTVTDSTGHYAVAGVTPGIYRVQATKNGYTTGISDPFTVSSGITSSPSDMQLSISLRSLYGTVTLEGKTDFTGVRITATKTTSTKEIYSALSNKDGFYALNGMTPGEYIVSCSYEGYRSYTSSSVSLKEDSSCELEEIILKKATGKISGIVNLEGCTDHSGITVSLVGTDYTYITEADGLYEFTVPSGNYPGGVRFEKEDFQLTAKAETIPVLTDSTYGVLTVEMKAIANTIKGVIKLAGTEDYSGITVTVDGLDAATTSYITEEDGNWQLDHIPLGYQTIRFTKLNVPDVTVEREIIASEFMEIGTLEMIPDSATLKGFAFLDGMTDNSGINVTITTLNKDDIVVRTTSDGAFIANNILASGSHTVTFSKEGWDSQSITIDDFEPLEERIIGSSRDYVLKDTTAPAWGSAPVVINSGANFANNTKVHLDLSPVEKGSGIEKMSVQIARTVDGVAGNLYPSSYNWQNYQIGFDFDINDLPDQYVGNGTYTFYIALKDKSGNISLKANKSITLTNLVTSLSGVLTGDKLHLVEECSPYLVEADCLVSEGDTLVIEPGVEVRFAGEYSISVSGGIFARGTAGKKILFTSDCVNKEHTYTTTEWGEWYDDDGNYQWGDHEVTRTEVRTVYWNGIAINGGSVTTENTYNYVSGNIMEYCEFEYANTPLTINAGIYINKCHFYNNTSSVVKNSEASSSTIIMNNVIENGIAFSRDGCLINNKINSSLTICDMYSWRSDTASIFNNTFENATINFDYGSCANIQNNSFINCTLSGFGNTDDGFPYFNNNMLIDCPSPIVSTTWNYKSGFAYNFTNNYWGDAQTDELNSKGAGANISFISDYYDNFNYARIDYSNWATEPFENCGYSESGFITFDYSVNGYDFTSDSGFYPETKDDKLRITLAPQYYDYDITKMRFAQSYEELKNTEWENYAANTNFTVDKTKLVNGAATLYVQIKDSVGNVSSSVVHNIPYDTPVISFNLENETTFSSNTKKYNLSYSATDLGNITGYSILIDGGKIQGEFGNSWGTSFGNTYELPICYMPSGTHSLKMSATDSAGNTGEKTITFIINRAFDVNNVANVSFDTSTGQLLKDADTLHLWHLDNDGKEVLGNSYLVYSHTNGGFEGSSSSVNGSVPLDITTNAFTVEFWTRGNGNVSVGKDSVFNLQNSYDNYLNHYYITSNEIKNDSIWTSNSAHSRSDDQWHYWAYVYTENYVTIYCDGVCVSYKDGFIHTLNTNNNNLRIEANGIIDELRISKTARTADEIWSYYKTAKPILDANTGSLEAIVY